MYIDRYLLEKFAANAAIRNATARSTFLLILSVSLNNGRDAFTFATPLFRVPLINRPGLSRLPVSHRFADFLSRKFVRPRLYPSSTRVAAVWQIGYSQDGIFRFPSSPLRSSARSEAETARLVHAAAMCGTMRSASSCWAPRLFARWPSSFFPSVFSRTVSHFRHRAPNPSQCSARVHVRETCFSVYVIHRAILCLSFSDPLLLARVPCSLSLAASLSLCLSLFLLADVCKSCLRTC